MIFIRQKTFGKKPYPVQLYSKVANSVPLYLNTVGLFLAFGSISGFRTAQRLSVLLPTAYLTY